MTAQPESLAALYDELLKECRLLVETLNKSGSATRSVKNRALTILSEGNLRRSGVDIAEADTKAVQAPESHVPSEAEMLEVILKAEGAWPT